MITYQIRLPKRQDAEAFVKFMREEDPSAVHKGPTRVGKVTDLVLLQAEAVGRTTGCEFFWHIGWSGLAMSASSNHLRPALNAWVSVRKLLLGTKKT